MRVWVMGSYSTYLSGAINGILKDHRFDHFNDSIWSGVHYSKTSDAFRFTTRIRSSHGELSSVTLISCETKT